MKKKLRVLLCLLALVCLLCVSVNAEEAPILPEQTGTIQTSDPEAPQSGLRTSALRADDTLAEVKKTLKQGLLAVQDSIDVSQYEIFPEEFKTIYKQVVDENPELFYVNGGYDCDVPITVSNVYPYYELDRTTYAGLPEAQRSEIKQRQAALEQVVGEIVAQVDASWTELQKALFLHDYLATHAQYDTTYTGYDAYTILVKGTGVCEAYTRAYRLLLNRVGIASGIVRSQNLDHVWNLVRIAGSWYHIDVTWDDPLQDRIGQVSHKHFCTSDAKRVELVKDEKKDQANWTFKLDWEYSLTVTTSASFDSSYWASVDSAFVPLDGTWYYLSYFYNENSGIRSELMQTQDPAQAGTRNKLLNAVWYDWTDSRSYWIGVFSGLSSYNGGLIYNTTDTVYRYDPKAKTEQQQQVYKLTAEEKQAGYLYGTAVDGNSLRYMVLQTPNIEVPAKVYTQKLDLYETVREGGYAYYLQAGKLRLKPSGPQTGIVIAAWYDADGRMLGTKRLDGQELTVSVSGAETVKIFTAAETTYQPLCKATELSAE